MQSFFHLTQLYGRPASRSSPIGPHGVVLVVIFVAFWDVFKARPTVRTIGDHIIGNCLRAQLDYVIGTYKWPFYGTSVDVEGAVGIAVWADIRRLSGRHEQWLI